MLCYLQAPIILYQSIQEKLEIMEEHRNNEIFSVDRKQMRAVDGKTEIYLEWPYIEDHFVNT